MKENYSRKTAQFLETFIAKEGYRLIKTEFVNEEGNWYLRAYIDLTEEEKSKRKASGKEAEAEAAEAAGKDGSAEAADSENVSAELSEENESCETEEPGIGINDCALVSRRLSKWLDKEDFIDEVYTLEVCSPGYLSESNENVQ